MMAEDRESFLNVPIEFSSASCKTCAIDQALDIVAETRISFVYDLFGLKLVP